MLPTLTGANFKSQTHRISISYRRYPLERFFAQLAERIETLMRLGLTLNQARAYHALVDSGPVGAKELAKKSKITRQDIYRVLPALQETGIVEKILGSPSLYQAIPMQQAISILLTRKIAEQKDLQKRSAKLLLDFRNHHPEKREIPVDVQFTIVPGKEVILGRIAERLRKAQESIDVVLSKERFSGVAGDFTELYKEALERGVRIRIAAELQDPIQVVPKDIEVLESHPGFELRFFNGPPEAVLSMIDGKEAFVTLSPAIHLQDTSALLSSNSSFVALARSYFNSIWSRSQKKTGVIDF